MTISAFVREILHENETGGGGNGFRLIYDNGVEMPYCHNCNTINQYTISLFASPFVDGGNITESGVDSIRNGENLLQLNPRPAVGEGSCKPLLVFLK